MQTSDKRRPIGPVLGGVSTAGVASSSSSGSGGINANGAAGLAAIPSECWDSLSYLESAFLHGFMRSRLKTGDFVYYENARVTRELDEFCDVDAMHQPKGPIILLGESGVGKSTFLANWLVRRKKMFQNWQSSYPEFIFYHVVGCSRQSLYVSNLLERILREIKEYFELNKEIPDVEERLSWQFPRFLEAASKKGRIILIIDGLQRLRTTDGESILKWVPLAFPPNVRLIFSGTISSPATKYMHMASNLTEQALPHRLGIQIIDQFERPTMNAQLIERIKLEANRRKWTLVNMAPLLEEERLRLVKKFLHKYHPSRVTRHDQAVPKPASASDLKSLLAIHGLQLFDLQQRAAVSVPMSASPNFLKTFLVAVAWAVNEGYNVHVLFQEWLSSESQGQLLEAMLRTMEIGYTPSEQSTVDAKQFLHENRSTLTADATPAANRRNSSQPATHSDKNEYSASHSHSSGPGSAGKEKQLAIPDFGHHGGKQTNVDLRFDEIQEPGDPGFPEMRRMDSQHEVAEVFVRTLGPRSESHTSMLLAMPELPTVELGELTSASASATGDTSGRTPGSAKHAGHSRPTSSSSSQIDTTHSGDKILSRKNIDAMPPYLTGGLYVPPLGDLLGRALCLLYVSRHGLLEKELKFILNAVLSEERQNAESAHKLHRKASFSNVKNISSESPTAFSEAQWKALLRALKPLGVLFVQDVVGLPTCKESLRDVVWWRYIGSERAEQQYHQWLIRFFRIHPTTFRRVEELPWHLKRCYQWDSLRNVLVNLPMFQLLYTAQYKNELFGYWKLLIDGPLPLYNAQDSTNTDPLVYAVAFDVVKEYGKSLEEWYKSARPTTKAFTAMIQLITRFMYEFSMNYQGYLPVFNHTPFDLKKLYADGFLFAEDLPHVQQFAASSSAITAATAASNALSNLNANASPMAMSAAASAASALNIALDAYPTLNQQAAVNVVQKDKESNGNWFYYYQRWIWIQFPWLALGKEIMLREPQVEVPVRSKAVGNGGSSAIMTGSSIGLGGFSFESAAPPSSGLDSADLGDDEVHRDASGTLVHAAGGGSSATAQAHGNARTLQIDSRFWDVKKSMFDLVHQRPKGSMSPSKVRALQNSSTLNGPAPVTQTEDLISPENLFRKKATYAAVKAVLTSSVRTLPGTSSASVPTLPTVPELTDDRQTFLTEAALARGSGEKREGNPDSSTTLGSVKTGAATRVLGTRDQALLDQLTSMDSVASLSTAFGLPAHYQDYPQNEWDLRKSYNYELVLKLQTLYDNAKLEVKKKQSHLQSVKLKISETQKRYEFTMRECEMAKNAIDEMHVRMDKIENMLKQIDKQEKSHRKLLRSCELFPPTDLAHFETAKKELKLMQMKLKDLVEEKKVLQVQKTHLQTIEVPVLQREIERNKELMSAVVAKLERAREKMGQDQAATDKLHQRRLELIDNVRNAAMTDPADGTTLEQEASAVRAHTVSASTRSLAAKVALQQCESMCEKIQKATGFSKLELILEKFVSREELNRSFEEQAKVYEARLKQIKLHQVELEQQLQELEMSNAVTSTEDPRMLEEKLRVAEVELARTERTQNVLLTTSKEVIAGASRIVKLMGITSCRTPHQNAIAAAQLWPPPMNSDSHLSSEFETLEAKEIVNLLQICQDRAGLMVDVIEGGRGDPDENFATTRESRSRRSKGSRAIDDQVNTKPGGRGKRMSVAGTKKDRAGGDRPSVLGASFPANGGVGSGLVWATEGLGVNTSMHDHPATPELDEDEKNLDVLTRDAIKVSSRAKISQKKRIKDLHSPTHAMDGDMD